MSHARELLQPATAGPRQGLPARLIAGVLRGVARVAPNARPRLQRGLIRVGYTVVNRLVDRDQVFMNFGYAPAADAPETLQLRAEDYENEFAIRLYHRVAGAWDLQGKDVLEVGCGRGGGASFMARYLRPRSLTGVDFATRAVRFCRQRHQHDALRFLEGSAEALPFEEASFDAVVNVESSHCYPSFERFLDEARRVLRPGGRLLFADLRPHAKVDELRRALARAFTIVDEEVITGEVFLALERYSDRRSEIIERTAPRVLRNAFRNFAAVKGSATYEAFRRRELEYVRFVLEKPAAARGAVAPPVLWFTGLSGAGKSTIAEAVVGDLRQRGVPTEYLDGDAVRALSPAGFSRAERDLHVRRVGFLASRLQQHGVTVVCALISPHEEARAAVRQLCRPFVEIHVATPVEECERRDVKGLYARARRGEIANFTGVSDPYEPPLHPELKLDTTELGVADAAARVVEAWRAARGR